MNKTYIGIAGLARAGKNLFADIAIDILKEKNVTTKTFALAYYLKEDCADFIKTYLDLSVYSEKNEEKEIFRPLLVWYGDVKRKQTKGRYWIESLQKDLEASKASVNIITDIRYTVYDRDECYWLQKELGGKLVHIAKYNIDSGANKIFDLPPNDHEAYNDPILQKAADIKIEWEAIGNKWNNSYICMLKDPLLRKVVNESLLLCNIE
jgi:hypothetical protein